MAGNASNSFRASDGHYYRKIHDLAAKYIEKCEKTLLRPSKITQKLNSCTNKKISRQHGLLQAEKNGKLTLTSVHVNPCFYKKKGENTYAMVNEGDTVVLQDGDCFGLLPTSYQYKVVIRHDGRETEQLQEVSSSAPVSPLEKEEVKENGALPELNDKVKDYATDTANTEKKNRKLPKWMLGEEEDDDEEKDARNKGKKTGQQKGRHKRKVDESKPTRRKKAKGNENELSQEDVENEDIEAGENNEKASKASEKIKSEDGEAAVNNKGEEDNSKENEDSVEKTVEDIEVDRENEDGVCLNENYESTNEDSTDTKADKQQKVRPFCTYGAACYRKNPAHKRDFSHPGDPDYVDASHGNDDDDDDSRPECEYGTACYRKNPDHKKQFKHTQNTQQAPKARAAAKKKTQEKKDEVDDEEDYDYDDSFLNDTSSDDFQVTDSDSSETDMSDDSSDKDDTKQMIKEVKEFLSKKRKLKKT